jgi:hypothetical protein
VKFKKTLATVAILGSAAIGLTACQSDAKTVSDNISKEADQFNVQRKITVLNTRSGEFMFYAEGRCSVERDNGWLVAICRHAPDEYRKHLIGPATDAFPSVEQLAPIDVSRYHTEIIVKPEGIIPDIKLRGGEQ